MIFLAVLLLGLPLAFLIRSLTDEGWRPIISLRVLQEREVVYLPEIEVFLVHNEDGPIALSAISSHLEDRVVYCRPNQTFEERHGSKFDRHGRYIYGPAPRGLDRIALRVRDGDVEINLAQVTPGPNRDVEATPIRGDLCEVPGPEDPPGFAAQEYDPTDDPL